MTLNQRRKIMKKLNNTEDLAKAVIEKVDHEPSERAHTANNFGQTHSRERYLWFDLASGTVELCHAPQGCVMSSYEERLIVKAIDTPVIESDLENIDEDTLDAMRVAWAEDRASEARVIAHRLADEILEYAMSENVEWDADTITEIAPDFEKLDPRSESFIADAAAMINASVDENLATTVEDIGYLVEQWLDAQND